jgi:hypothetical protein
MAGLVPAIHVFPPYQESKTWITGTSPVMTIESVPAPSLDDRHMPRHIARRCPVEPRIIRHLDLPPERAKAGALIKCER